MRFHPSPDSLNSRFAPLSDLATDAVFAVDDDIRVPCADLALAFEVWVAAPRTLVGFFPRLHTLAPRRLGDRVGGPVTYEYHSWWYVWWHGAYSMVLTKAAVFHKAYLGKYTADMPAAVRQYVDDHMNCEVQPAAATEVAESGALAPTPLERGVGSLSLSLSLSTFVVS